MQNRLAACDIHSNVHTAHTSKNITDNNRLNMARPGWRKHHRAAASLALQRMHCCMHQQNRPALHVQLCTQAASKMLQSSCNAGNLSAVQLKSTQYSVERAPLPEMYTQHALYPAAAAAADDKH
jgi:hypothetical protein